MEKNFGYDGILDAKEAFQEYIKWELGDEPNNILDTADSVDMVDFAKKSEDFFMCENMEDLNKQIEEFEGSDPFEVVDNYRPTVNIKAIREIYRSDLVEGMNLLSDVDRKAYIEALKIEREAFKKRVNTYLKRYGTSKVHSWSYWQDE